MFENRSSSVDERPFWRRSMEDLQAEVANHKEVGRLNSCFIEWIVPAKH